MVNLWSRLCAHCLHATAVLQHQLWQLQERVHFFSQHVRRTQTQSARPLSRVATVGAGAALASPALHCPLPPRADALPISFRTTSFGLSGVDGFFSADAGVDARIPKQTSAFGPAPPFKKLRFHCRLSHEAHRLAANGDVTSFCTMTVPSGAW